ncbi:MAG: putative heme-binding domain-containing protein [Verrucomicrobiales bacterium]|jgi:putative heme-binding domain-containing protein
MLVSCPLKFFVLIASGLFSLIGWAAAADGTVERKPWKSSKVKGSPDPPKPYVGEPVFVGLAIEQGVEMITLGERIFVGERGGKIWSFPDRADVEQADLFVDLKAIRPKASNAYGLAFHPDWKENHEVFLTYIVGGDQKVGSRLSRFQFVFEGTEPPRIDRDSEEVILTWPSGGHNGANIQFGPDGMLYLSTGDATPPNPPDILNTGQDNSDILSSVLRIDVEGTGYRIPPDNPFVGREGVRPEIWAFGFRNPWKMSFDARGRLWLGDVGWELWEMIHLVERGGNYGWSAMEASNPVKPETASSLSPISSPVAAHRHTEAASITGGYEYQGSRLPELRGAYVYGDYETGKIWALRHDGESVVEHIEIADTPHKISTFGLGADGELYYIHYGSPATIYRLAPNPRSGKPSEFPRKLSETGLFADTTQQLLADGVYEFGIHEPMWQDGAESTRFIGLPGESGVDTEILYQENGRRSITTTWPTDAVLAKTIRLRETPVETQVLHFDGDAWNGYSYRWNEAATDAVLVGAEGEEFDVPKSGWRGGERYRIPSRAECMRCHSMWNEFTPAFEPMQLAEFAEFPRLSPREIAIGLGLANSEFFFKNTNGELLSSRGNGSKERRARSWLHANCAHCHRRHGGGSAPLEVNFERSISESITLWEAPTRGDFGLTDSRIIVPGQPWRSVLNYRINAIGSGHMPPLGPREVDEKGARLLWDWIAGMPTETEPNQDDPSLAEASSAMLLAHSAASGGLKGKERAAEIERGLNSPNQNVRALFERFRAPAERPAPARIDPDRILTLTGDAENGARLLTLTGKLASCFACHQLDGVGGQLGPDLTKVGARLNRQQLLESLLEPSKTVAPEFQLWSVVTNSDETLSGFIVNREGGQLTLKLTTGQTRTLAEDQIASKKSLPLSLMPEGLLNLLTDQEAADLLALLLSKNEK